MDYVIKFAEQYLLFVGLIIMFGLGIDISKNLILKNIQKIYLQIIILIFFWSIILAIFLVSFKLFI